MNLKSFIKNHLTPDGFRNQILKFALKGKQVECVCCGNKYETFLPAGIIKRPNAKCINCGSLERHRTLWHFLKTETDLFNRDSIKMLHPAPEKLFYKKFNSHKNINYTSIDLNPEMYDYGSKTIKMDLTDLKFDNETFDAIICNHVLEHIPNDAKAMNEMFRVLKNGGWALINVPVDMNREVTFEDVNINDPKKQLELFGQPDHVRIYGRDYINRLEKAGFNVKVITYAEKFTHNELFKYGMKPTEKIFYCTK